MKWTRGTRNDDVVDIRGRKVAGGAGMKFGVGTVVALIAAVLISKALGVDLTGLVGGGGGGGPAQKTASGAEPPATSTAEEDDLIEQIKFVMKDIQDTFDGVFKANGKTYRRATLKVFSNAVDTGCGRSSSAIGPFYCPPDESAYVDLTFFRDLEQRFKAAGDFAQDYVLAHEIGHHCQNILGIEAMTQKIGKGQSRNAVSVRQELQADCYAGVWGHSAAARKLLDAGDLEEALTAANAIGDDRLQKQAGREVSPETFTHGTSEQRMKWFRRGFESGRLDACDTFSVEP